MKKTYIKPGSEVVMIEGSKSISVVYTSLTGQQENDQLQIQLDDEEYEGEAAVREEEFYYGGEDLWY